MVHILCYADIGMTRKYSLGFHTYCIYKFKDGQFDNTRHTQVENTSAVIYYLGDS